ncbi:2-hydroxyacid dehydrogenase [Aeromicrobium sp. CTD01-1L150]|uniref:2-hydroxyacid dehydrogenase n=1 Tax=Aeromicrobium sp. CTD01-1L150 TaxID=3341830 RepID=UPI0035BF6791
MTTILTAGDLFVRPTHFADAVRAAVADPSALKFTELTSSWPLEPFGPVENVEEASGAVDELIAALQGVEVAVTQMAPFSARVFEACPDLRFIGVCRGGPVNVDIDAATEAGVLVSNAPGRNAQAAAEFAVGLMLAALRHVPPADAELRAGTWRGDYYTWENAGRELGGETVGLVGLGSISRITARILQAFGAVVIAHDPYAEPEPGVELVDLDELLVRSGVVSLHARLTPETHHLINSERLHRMRPGALLVNTARGGLLDHRPLPDLLASGHLGGLALDVYDVEPPPEDWPLLSAPNVVLSPHLAGATRQTAERATEIIAEEVARFLGDAECRHTVNPGARAKARR